MLHARSDYAPIQDPRPNGIPEMEPVILFRAQDKHAIDVAEFYLDRVQQERPDDPMNQLLIDHIERMKRWQDAVMVKTPDVPIEAQPFPITSEHLGVSPARSDDATSDHMRQDEVQALST
jgi:hypothetical protein